MADENASDFVENGSWSDDIGDRIPLFKGEAGYMYRVAFLSEPIKRLKCHYVKGKGYIICKSRPAQKDATGKVVKEATQGVCCKRLEEARWRVGSVILKYATDRNGVPTKPPQYTIHLFTFGQDKFGDLKLINSEMPLNSHDVKIKAEGGEYQKMTFTGAMECIWKHPDLKWETTVRTEAAEAEKSLVRVMGRLLTDEKMAELVGEAGPAAEPTNVVTESADLDGLLENIK